MNIIIENNTYMKKFFDKYPKYKEALVDEINGNILNMINNKPHKIKTVASYKYKNKVIYEYKIVMDEHFVCRVAYVICENDVIVFYLSTNIIKAKFTKEVSTLKGVNK